MTLRARPPLTTRVAGAYRNGFAARWSRCLASAARQFNPYVVETRVADTWRGFVILDRRCCADMAGDVMNDGASEIRVEHAGADCAVAVLVLGTPKDGAVSGAELERWRFQRLRSRACWP